MRHRQGAVDPPPVLVSAGPGTGKTWSALQLAHELAVLSGGADSKGGFGAFAPVPILIFVQRLSRHVRSARQQRLPYISRISPLYLPYVSPMSGVLGVEQHAAAARLDRGGDVV